MVKQRQNSIQDHLNFEASKDQAWQLTVLSHDVPVLTQAMLCLVEMSQRLLLRLQSSWQHLHCSGLNTSSHSP